MDISLYKHYILPIDTSDPNPLLGRIDEEDKVNERYLTATWNSSQVFQGYRLFDFSDLRDTYMLFKGLEEAQTYFSTYWP